MAEFGSSGVITHFYEYYTHVCGGYFAGRSRVFSCADSCGVVCPGEDQGFYQGFQKDRASISTELDCRVDSFACGWFSFVLLPDYSWGCSRVYVSGCCFFDGGRVIGAVPAGSEVAERVTDSYGGRAASAGYRCDRGRFVTRQSADTEGGIFFGSFDATSWREKVEHRTSNIEGGRRGMSIGSRTIRLRQGFGATRDE